MILNKIKMCLQQLADKIRVNGKNLNKISDHISASLFHISIDPKGLIFTAGADHKNNHLEREQEII